MSRYVRVRNIEVGINDEALYVSLLMFTYNNLSTELCNV